MGWFWADSTGPTQSKPNPSPKSAGLPPPGCPMHSASPKSYSQQNFQSPPAERGCPVQTSDAKDSLNPLNFMFPNLSQSRATSQKTALPVERTTSSIPRGDAESNWEYPSPQQMYNAMLRKGFDDTPEDAMEVMVAVHNFLNEGAWEQVEAWEERFSRGLAHGWQTCSQGEESFTHEARSDSGMVVADRPKLLRFQGRPGEMTPKAQILSMLGWAYPSRFGFVPPFDRHDWYVLRQLPNGQEREVRYVIDYYSAAPEPTGEPVFYLDVRPAVDGPTAAAERLLRWGGDFWHRASGGQARQQTSE